MTAAIDYGKYGVRVSAIHPGAVLTPILRAAMESNVDVAKTINDSVKYQSVPRIGEPEEISQAVAFLVSDDSSFITGISLPVDGGLILGKATPLA